MSYSGSEPDRFEPSSAPSLLNSTLATIPSLFPRRSINFIVGDTKTGRLRLALTQLDNYAATTSPTFLDYRLHRQPQQLGCVLCGKDRDQIWHQVRDMGLENLERPRVFPIVRWYPSRAEENEPLHHFPLDHAYAQVQAAAGGEAPRFLLVEGLQLLMSNNKQNEQQAVAIFMDKLQEFVNERDCSVLGIVGVPKSLHPDTVGLAHRIAGSFQWADGARTIIGIERVKLTRTEAEDGELAGALRRYRRVSFVLPGADVPDLYVRFDDQGALRVQPRPEEATTAAASDRLDEFLKDIGAGQVVSGDRIREWTTDLGISVRTMRRWVAGKVKSGELVKLGTTTGAGYRRGRMQ